VGKILKEMYVDSALKKSSAIAEKYPEAEEPHQFQESKNISWREYKHVYL
jgi:hypothetical protein